MSKKKILGILALFTTFALTIASCDAIKDYDASKSEPGVTTSTDTTGTKVSDEEESVENETTEAPEVVDASSTLEVTVEANTELGVGSYTIENNIYTITSQGEYTFKGDLKEGSIVVDAEDADVIINLNGVNITSTSTSPINIIAASNVEISAKSGTVNYITDKRTTDTSDLSAAIYSTSDLKLKGKGELYIYGNYNNGIHSKDDLTIKNLTLYVKALNNAIKGNDSVEIENANLTVISTGGDGIKSTNTDISSKGNQKGTITIIGSTVMSVYACCDGIDAAYNVEIEADDEGEPEINIYTNAYSSYSDDTPTTLSSSSTIYLQISSSYYSTSYSYYAYCYDVNDTSTGDWIKFDYYTQVTSGMGFGGRNQSVYYYLKADVDPSIYSGIQIYMFASSQTPSTTDYYAQSTGQAINETKDMLVIKSVTSSTKKIGIDWSNYSTTSTPSMPGGMGGMDQGNTDKTSYSTKGIKANNEIIINAGNILIKSYDDALHATSNVTLENGETSKGDITINGGTISLLSKDDGIHADNNLIINSGSINVSSSYEGLEANYIYINGGNHSIYGTDDGINASKAIIVAGGVTSILVASGDTDAIDSNGTYTQTGGVIISMNMSSSGTASVLDCDSTTKITGGVFLAFGRIEKTPSLSNVKSTTKSASISKGSYNLTYNGEVIATFTTSASYQSFTLIGASGSYQVGSTSISL